MIWVAYYYDRSGAAVFVDELACYRYAMSGSMQVKAVPVGADIFQYEPAPEPSDAAPEVSHD